MEEEQKGKGRENVSIYQVPSDLIIPRFGNTFTREPIDFMS